MTAEEPSTEVERVPSTEVARLGPGELEGAVQSEVDAWTLMMDPRRSRLRRRMATISDTAFAENEEMHSLYTEVLANMLLESETVPGFGTLTDTAIELYAYCWTEHKSYANMAEPLPALVYEKLVNRLLKAVQVITKARDEANADERFKRQFIGVAVQAVADTIIAELADDPDVALRVTQAVIAKLRDHALAHDASAARRT